MYMRAFYRCCLALLLALPLSAWATGELQWRVESLDPVRRPMQPERLRDWSATGKKLMEMSLQSEEATGAESLESLPAGLYLLEFSTASGEILQTRWEKL